MSKEHSPDTQHSPEDLDLVPIYEAAKRVFDDIVVIDPGEYVDIEGTPVPSFGESATASDDNPSPTPKSALETKRDEYDKLWHEYEQTKDPEVLKKAEKLKKKIFWLEEANLSDKRNHKRSK